MSSPTIMKRVGDAAKGYMGKLKSLPPDSGEQASIKDKAYQVNALKNTTVPTEPERTGSEPMPMPAYGSRPGEKRLEYALKPAPTSIPTYDQGGDVKVQPVEKEALAAPGQKKSPLAMKPVIHETMNVNTGKPSSSLPPLTPDIKPMSMPRVYDDGGDVDVNDGKHQVAILKEGEKVLTPEQAAAYRAGQQQGAPADFAGRVIPNPTGIKIKDVDSVQPRADEPTGGAKMSTDNAPLTPPKGDTSNAPLDEAQPTDASTGSQKARPYADVAAEQKKAAEEKVANPGAQTGGAQEPAETKIEPKLPTATDAERLAIKTDQQKALGMPGITGLVPLAMTNIHAKQLGLDTEDLSHVEDKLNPTTGDAGIKQPGYMPGGAPPAGIPKMGDVTLPGSTPPPQPTMGQTALQGTSDMGDQAKAGMPKLGQQSFKDQLSQLKKDHSAALGERSAQGKVKADYIQAQINDLQRNNPYGSAGNHPGLLGKLGHIAAGVGNVAGDVLAPKTMALIPGTQLNKGLAANKLQAETAEDQKNATAQAAAEAKPGAQDVYKEATQGGLVDPAHTELGPQQAYVDEHDPSKVHFAGPMPPKEGKGSDQASFVKQWYADNPTVTKSAENDAKAIQAYHASTAPPTTLMVPVPGHPGMLQATQVQPGQQITEEAAKPGAAAAEANKAKGKVYYYDTASGRQGYTYGEATAAGLKPEDGYAVSAQQVEKDRKANDTYEGLKSQLAQYKGNIEKSAGQLLPSDVENMSAMIESTESPDYVSKIISGALDDFYGKPVTGYNEKIMKGSLTKKAYDDMSSSARQLVADYFTTLLAHFGNVKASLGQVPRNEKLITTEMNMIPKPYLSANEAEPAFSNYTAQVERNNAHNVKFANTTAPAAAKAPAGADQEGVDANGKVVGHMVNGKWVPLQQ